MKNIIIVLALGLLSLTSNAQYYTIIPDANFEQALIDLGYDTGTIDGRVTTSKIDTVTSLIIEGKNISDLTGIENFENLTELDCSFNDLTNIDVSSNINLTYLNCYYNSISNIDVSANVNLTYLNSSYNGLTSLDVSNNVSLINLYCMRNSLTALDVSNNVNLDTLICGDNSLTVLDVSNNVNLTYLGCGGSDLLTALDVSNNVNLTEFDCSYSALSSLDLSNNVNLIDLNCGYNSLTALDVSKNVKLANLSCYNNSITSLDLSNNVNLTMLSCSNNNLYSLRLNNLNLLLTLLQINNNPNLFCVELADYENISFQSNPRVDPQTYFVSHCEYYSKIEGFFFFDTNENGVQDIGETGIAGAAVSLPTGEEATTNQLGYYQLFTPETGSLTLSGHIPEQLSCDGATYQPGSVTAPEGGQIIVNVDNAGASSINNNFGVYFSDVISCGTVCGHVFNDANENGVQDFGESGEVGVTIEFTPGGYTSTDINGNYCTTAEVGSSIGINIEERVQNYSCSDQKFWSQTTPVAPNTYTVTVNNTIQNDFDFGVSNITPSYDVSLYSVRPYHEKIGDDFKVFIDYKSFGETTENCTLILEHDVKCKNISTSRFATNKTDTSIEWEFLPGQTPSFECMEMTFNLDETLTNPGDELVWKAKYYCGGDSANSTDLCDENNRMIRRFQLPNPVARVKDTRELFNSMDMYVNGEQVDQDISTADSLFSFVINYRNETYDTVYHLYIIDTLPAAMNVSTVSRPFSNFPYTFRITDENVLIWEIKNVAIPPMITDTINSYGFVQYNVIMKQGVTSGTEIENKATIKYNYNGEIKTNTVRTKVEAVTSLNEKELEEKNMYVFPNPSYGDVRIQLVTEKSLLNPKVECIDAMGKTHNVQTRTLTTGTYEIATENLVSGLYIINLWDGENLVGSSKMVKN